MRVFDCSLEPRLKPLASLCALYADDGGGRIWPSVGRLAWGLGITPRAVQQQLSALRQLKVLIPVTDLRGGARRSTEYELRIPPELERSKFKPQGRTSVRSSESNRDEDTFVVSRGQNDETTKPDTENHEAARTGTTNPRSPNHEASFTRSVSDPPIDPPKRKAADEQAPAAPASEERDEKNAEPEPASARSTFLDRLKTSHPQLAEEFQKVRTVSA